jgi:hypothetical protein
MDELIEKDIHIQVGQNNGKNTDKAVLKIVGAVVRRFPYNGYAIKNIFVWYPDVSTPRVFDADGMEVSN